MKKKKVALGNKPIMFGDIKGCGACQAQDQIIKMTCNGLEYTHIHSPLNRPAYPFLKDMGIPTWYVPTGNGKGFLHEGKFTIKFENTCPTNLDLASEPRL